MDVSSFVGKGIIDEEVSCHRGARLPVVLSVLICIDQHELS